jgi:hypothetical protein
VILVIPDIKLIWTNRFSDGCGYSCETFQARLCYARYRLTDWPELLAKAASRPHRGDRLRDVRDPERYGVVTFDENDRPVRIDEMPNSPGSNWAITGLGLLLKVVLPEVWF